MLLLLRDLHGMTGRGSGSFCSLPVGLWGQGWYAVASKAEACASGRIESPAWGGLMLMASWVGVLSGACCARGGELVQEQYVPFRLRDRSCKCDVFTDRAL